MNNSIVQHLLHLGIKPETASELLPKHLTLSLIDGVLFLCDVNNDKRQLCVDFIAGGLKHRSQQHLGGENLIKACQIKGQDKTRVLDATCGLGVDGFLLHQAGFTVTACEQHPVIYALLQDGINRLHASNPEQSFTAINQDSRKLMTQQSFDVIYLDPMFPHNKKTAKNKLGMQLFQDLYQDKVDDAAELVQLALATACRRVVIKRPKKAALVTTFKPTFQVLGKNCRFDAYQNS